MPQPAFLPLWRRCGYWCSHLSLLEKFTCSKHFYRALSTSFRISQCRKNQEEIKKDVNQPSSSMQTDKQKKSEKEGKAERVSQINIQMLSKSLHQQIFGRKEPPMKEYAITRSRKHLKAQGLWGKKGSALPDVDVELPPLMGENIDGHFRNIADMQSRPYLDLAVDLVRTPLPPMPKEWSFSSGWTKYDVETGEATLVDYPEDAALVFDVEVCTMESPRPILATAVSPRFWYSWVSKRLTSSEDFYANMQRRTVLSDLIPFETVESELESDFSGRQERQSHRLIVGHNVSYDRARIKEQYFLKVRE